MAIRPFLPSTLPGLHPSLATPSSNSCHGGAARVHPFADLCLACVTGPPPAFSGPGDPEIDRGWLAKLIEAFDIRRVASVRQNVWWPEQEGVECGRRRPDQRPAGRCSPPCVVLPAGA